MLQSHSTNDAACEEFPIPVAGHLIDGELRRGSDAYDVVNPAQGRVFARCPSATRQDLDDAVAAARREAPAWRALEVEQRRSLIFDFADRMVAAAPDIAPLLTQEHGKPLEQARFELTVAAHHMKQLASIDIRDEVLRDDEARGRVLLRYHPLGVVGAIAPWNFPIALAMHKVAQALYTGNTLILKPSPFTPLATLAVAALALEVFPAGVVNIIAGGNEFGAWMSAHPGIDKISFTGSVETGKKVMASASATLKRITLELGGNDAAVVLDDADLDVVAPGLARSAFYNSGQICMATKRVYVADSLHDAFVERLTQALEQHRVGDGMSPDSTLGPLQNAAQFDKVKNYLEGALAQPGAELQT
ncbi:MAG: aldehyde dehydrogenase family protein, partial [Brevundimonas sp.]